MTPPKTAREVLEYHINNITKYVTSRMTDGEYGVLREKEIDTALQELAELVSVDSIEKELYLFNSKNQYTGFITTTRARTVYPIPHKRWMNPLAKTIHALITTKLGE